MKQPSFFIDIYDNAYYNNKCGNLSNKKEWLYMVSKPFTKNKHILVYGEVLIDEIIDNQGHNHGLVGGSAANVAINLAQLGIRSTFIGAKGNDAYGQLIQSTLDAAGCDTNYLITSYLNTSVVKMNQTVGTPLPKFHRGADSEIENLKAIDNLLDTVDILHFTYWPLSKNPAKKTLFELIKQAKAKNILLGFDPNIHEDLLTDSSMTTHERDDLFHQIDFLKASKDDLSRMYGKSLTQKEIINVLKPFNIPWVIITLGKEGVMVLHDEKEYHFETLAKEVIDATGAGDAFISGFYTSFLHNNSLIQMIKDAQTLSAIVLNHLGAITKIPNYKNLHKGA